MTKEELTSITKQPLMSTGTTEQGFKKENKEKRITDIPRIGQGIVGDDGITGTIR
ncbi:hypothetical protein [Mesobacillus campisalis]|uniref:hypothetical protein n=1 Tax=Mesobacillus campisalis TaxID=1408103 RepID=UPI000A931B57|nr:hypothetical protein [Mesobacillus campisalis]